MCGFLARALPVPHPLLEWCLGRVANSLPPGFVPDAAHTVIVPRPRGGRRRGGRAALGSPSTVRTLHAAPKFRVGPVGPPARTCAPELRRAMFMPRSINATSLLYSELRGTPPKAGWILGGRWCFALAPRTRHHILAASCACFPHGRVSPWVFGMEGARGSTPRADLTTKKHKKKASARNRRMIPPRRVPLALTEGDGAMALDVGEREKWDATG